MNKTVCVIGGGLGALSGAIRLSRLGFKVRLFEKNSTLGGKMNHILAKGFRYDTGPSLLTMPFVIDELFRFAGFNRSDQLTFEPLETICRYFFPDSTQFNVSRDLDKNLEEVNRIFPEQKTAFREYLDYAKSLYNLAAEIFLFTPIHEFGKILRSKYSPLLLKLHRLDAHLSMHQRNSKRFNDQRLVQIFDRYATYNGSNPFQAPATLNLISHVEFNMGGFYIRGGMYKLIQALERVAEELGVEIFTSTEVEKILLDNRKITGIQINGETVSADYVLCNADVVYAFDKLIDGFSETSRKLRKLEPSISGMVFLWGINKPNPQLSHHNIFFSSNYEREFNQIFHQLQAPDDPTIYINITSRTDPEHAPVNSENWFVLLNMPYLSGKQNWDVNITMMRKAILSRLKLLGIYIDSNIIFEQVLTPRNFFDLYNSNRGSIYGISSNSRFNAFKRPPNRSRQIFGLYFASGSAHPGGGIPLVLLSGKMAAEIIAENEGIHLTNHSEKINSKLLSELNIS